MFLPPELQELLGDLRGQEPPREDVLRRLRDINGNYRITWTWPTPDRIINSETVFGRTGLYWLHEVRPGNKYDELRKAAGDARLQRFEKFGDDRKIRSPGIPAQCEDMMKGYYGVGQWPRYVDNGVPPFGSERFFEELIEGEKTFKVEKARLEKEAALDGTADEQITEESDVNPEFRQHIRDVAEEFYPYVCKGRRDFKSAAIPKEGIDA